jgi:hypothetical protein
MMMMMIVTIMCCETKENACAKFVMISYTVYFAQSIQLEVCDTAD